MADERMMTTAAGTRQPIAAAQDTRRITESDRDYQRLHAATVRRLTASVRSLIADLRHGTPAQDAANAFARRHTDLLKQAYLAAHQAGAKDYYQRVSRRPAKWANRVQPSERVMVQRILFYAAGSVLKMANEAVQAWHDTQTAKQFAEPATPIQDYFTGLSGRLNLQGEIAWSGLNDGYTDAGGVDPASPYAVLYWDLGPVKTQHCSDCPRIAAGSPYDRPGSGGNQLDATPGDGHTECGAACHCSLRYGMAPTAEQAQSVWQDAKAVPPPPPGSLKWPNAPRPTQEELDAAQQKLLDDYRTQFDRWEAVRGDLPSLPDLFATQGSAGGWVTWDQLMPAQQAVLSDVFGVLAQADAMFGHPSLEEAAAAAGLAQEDLAALQAKIQGLSGHLDDFLAELNAASEADLEEWFGKGPIASFLWSLRQDFYDVLEWLISRTEPPIPPDQAQMAEGGHGYVFVGGHPPGYTQNRDRGGRWAPGEGRGESGGGGVHAPHGMAAAHGQHAHGGQGSAGGGGGERSKAIHEHKFSTDITTSKGDYATERLLMGYHHDAGPLQLRDRVVGEIADRLKGNADFQKLTALRGGDVHETILLLRTAWGGSSQHVLSIGLHRAAEEEFGLRGHDRHSAERLNSVRDLYNEYGAGMRAYVRAVYDNTQAYFAKQGITDVLAYRGMGWAKHGEPKGIAWNKGSRSIALGMRPLTSFSVNRSEARNFGSDKPYRMLVAARIPVSRILGTAQTGMGIIDEGELIVLGGRETVMAEAVSS